MKIYLLTHQREFKRPSNTGKIVTDKLRTMAAALLWERKNPNPRLLELARKENTVLLFNNPEAEIITESLPYENFILLDGTWQEAKKIFNKSPYLKSMKTINLHLNKVSAYKLRRNQKEQGLCTAECVVELLKLKGKDNAAEELQEAFLSFLRTY